VACELIKCVDEQTKYNLKNKQTRGYEIVDSVVHKINCAM